MYVVDDIIQPVNDWVVFFFCFCFVVTICLHKSTFYKYSLTQVYLHLLFNANFSHSD